MRIPQIKTAEAAASTAPQPRRRKNWNRWLAHASLAAAFGAGGWAILVWPQWIAVDGARAALQLQQEREQEYAERIDNIRAGNDRLRAWDRDGRRVFLADETNRIPVLVRALALRQGTSVAKVQVTNHQGGRWHPYGIESTTPNGTPVQSAEIRPRSVRIVLKGNFDALYRTVASLSQQQQLFVPDRWELSAGRDPKSPGGELWAEVWATVFVVNEPEERPHTPVASGPVAASIPLGTEG